MTTQSTTSATEGDERQVARIKKELAKRSFAVLATHSDAGYSHAAGVMYVEVDGVLYIHTRRTTRKARNVATNEHVGVSIPTRKLPGSPPYSIQFQGQAELVPMNDPRVTDLVKAGRLKKITSHGELDEPDGVFVVVRPDRRIHSYGIGVPMRDIIRDPVRNGPRSVLVG
jgi:general stress protein 26